MKTVTALLIIISALGLSSCLKDRFSKPEAAYTYTIPNECNVPFEVEFSNLSDGGSVFMWNFGDGSQSYEENPVHIYAAEGIYETELTVYNRGGMHSQIKLIYIVKSPQFNFFTNDTLTSVAQPVAFSTVLYTSVLPSAFFWNFGDGAISTEQNPVHIYNSPGFYTVTLTAVNACGSGFIEKKQYIKVNAAGVPPVADFLVSNNTIIAGQTVGFTDLSLNNPDSWSWSFQGASSPASTLQNPQNILYPNPGEYNVTLTATNSYGSGNLTKAAYIKVLASAPTKVYIKKITVKQMPFPPPPPDFVNLFYKITDPSMLYNSLPPYTVTQPTMPAVFVLSLQLPAINRDYKIELFDRKAGMPPQDIPIGFVQFNPNNFTSGANPYPSLITLTQNNINIDVELLWI